jgi:hypothetical protein
MHPNRGTEMEKEGLLLQLSYEYGTEAGPVSEERLGAGSASPSYLNMVDTFGY